MRRAADTLRAGMKDTDAEAQAQVVVVMASPADISGGTLWRIPEPPWLIGCWICAFDRVYRVF